MESHEIRMMNERIKNRLMTQLVDDLIKHNPLLDALIVAYPPKKQTLIDKIKRRLPRLVWPDDEDY